MQLRYQRQFEPEQLNELCQQIHLWGKNWILRFAGTFVNSCHVVWKHVPFYLKMYGDIYRFSQQGVEGMVKQIKRMRNGVFANINLAAEYMAKESRKLAGLFERKNDDSNTYCKWCNVAGHSRRSSKDCKFFQQH